MAKIELSIGPENLIERLTWVEAGLTVVGEFAYRQTDGVVMVTLTEDDIVTVSGMAAAPEANVLALEPGNSLYVLGYVAYPENPDGVLTFNFFSAEELSDG